MFAVTNVELAELGYATCRHAEMKYVLSEENYCVCRRPPYLSYSKKRGAVTLLVGE